MLFQNPFRLVFVRQVGEDFFAHAAKVERPSEMDSKEILEVWRIMARVAESILVQVHRPPHAIPEILMVTGAYAQVFPPVIQRQVHRRLGIRLAFRT